MAETERQVRLLRFGNFEVDLRAGELRKSGVKLKLTGQPFQVLTILLERPGEVVTREELQKRLWPDTFVDVDHNLNTAINKIREVLGDSAETPRFVETVPRRGYRFIAEVEVPVLAEVPVEPVLAPQPSRMGLKIAACTAVILILAVGSLVIYRWPGRQPSQGRQAILTPVPFTALPGEETSPALSPDGSRIAFAWNGDSAAGAKGFDLYVKAIGSETLLRLTQHPSEWISPTWSPDGTQIAFHRIDGANTGIYVVPALGGPERKLRSTRIPWASFSIISWSPDGKWIALADLLPGEEHAVVYLLSSETLEATRLRNDLKCLSQGQPAFSHSGDHLAYWCFLSGQNFSLHSLPLSDGRPKVLLHSQGYPKGLAWSSDDKALIYSVADMPPNEVGEVDVVNGSSKHLVLEANGEIQTISCRNGKLAYSSSSNSRNIWRRDLRHPEAPAVELASSTRAQDKASYSPDGERIVFASDRSGLGGIWISNQDGSNLIQISNPRYESGSPQWSPDGKKIAFDSYPVDRWEIYVADLTEGNPRKLVTNVSNIYRAHWSRDGKWIYFRSDEVGRAGIYRCPVSGGDAIALARDIEGVNPQESFDGKALYFASNQHKSVLKRLTLPAEAGTESVVDGVPRMVDSENWILSPSGIYFVPAESPRSLRYFDFASKQVSPIFEVDKDFSRGLSVSPDGRWILYSQVGDVNSDIMLVDNFR